MARDGREWEEEQAGGDAVHGGRCDASGWRRRGEAERRRDKVSDFVLRLLYVDSLRRQAPKYVKEVGLPFALSFLTARHLEEIFLTARLVEGN